jgi:hypothetical protein
MEMESIELGKWSPDHPAGTLYALDHQTDTLIAKFPDGTEHRYKLASPEAGTLCAGEPEPELHLTGVWATPDQRQKILEAIQTSERFIELAEQAKAPVGESQKEARRRLLEVVHQAAIENGLPEFDGFYGLDPSGQFIRG